MEEKKLRIGLIGTGGIAHSHMRAYLNMKDAVVVAGADLVPGRAEEFFKEFEVEAKAYTDYKAMIEEMRNEYDYIFLDCPPIDVVADASIITEHADMTIFVMRANQMDKGVLPEIESLYKSGKYNHMTMILNCVDIQFKKYGYGKSSYGYGYGNAD